MKVAVIKSNTFLDDKVKRIFELGNIKVDIVDKFTNKSAFLYQVVIFSSKNKIKNINLVFESIVGLKSPLVVYLNNTLNIGQFNNLINNSYFLNIEEHKIDMMLFDIVNASTRYLRVIKSLENDLIRLNNKILDDKTINNAKYFLIEKGRSEANSHKLIQKIAMDYRISKSEAASLIMKNKIDI